MDVVNIYGGDLVKAKAKTKGKAKVWVALQLIWATTNDVCGACLSLYHLFF